jgi:hypothetical protein
MLNQPERTSRILARNVPIKSYLENIKRFTTPEKANKRERTITRFTR